MSLELLKESLNQEIGRGLELIAGLDNETYALKRGDSGSIGAHFRHNLEFIEHFVAGIDSGRVDYCQRSRDTRVENDRAYAIERFETCIEVLGKLTDKCIDQAVLVNSEIDPDVWLGSTLGREIEFVHSHTVHHYALVSAKLQALGIKVPEDFGVAPSTLRYWSTLKTSSKGAK